MRDTILICAVATVFILGYFLMDKVDKFIESNERQVSVSSENPVFSIALEAPAEAEAESILLEDINTRVESKVKI